LAASKALNESRRRRPRHLMSLVLPAATVCPPFDRAGWRYFGVRFTNYGAFIFVVCFMNTLTKQLKASHTPYYIIYRTITTNYNLKSH